MMLENGAFNERRMSAVHLCHSGLLGDVFYGEAYYAHDLRDLFFPPEEQKRRGWYSEHWRNELRRALPIAARDSNEDSHNDVDALFQMRLVYCLRNGLPLPQDVYDLAAWSSICELTERSVASRSKAIDIPDFTRGARRLACPNSATHRHTRSLGERST